MNTVDLLTLLANLSFLASVVLLILVTTRVFLSGRPGWLWFRIYFGVWPEKNEHLKGLVRTRFVEPWLKTYAEWLETSYENQNNLFREIRDDKRLLYGEAKKRLFRSDREVRRAKRRFERAQDIAVRFGFAQKLTYGSYLPKGHKSVFKHDPI